MAQYVLEQRTKDFSQQVIDLCKNTPINTISRPIILQLIRSVTSIDANYREANSAANKNDFKSKIAVCKKEAKETDYWLKILIYAEPNIKKSAIKIQEEARQLFLIFSKLFSSLKILN